LVVRRVGAKVALAAAPIARDASATTSPASAASTTINRSRLGNSRTETPEDLPPAFLFARRTAVLDWPDLKTRRSR
jgi:hypothetical protein